MKPYEIKEAVTVYNGLIFDVVRETIHLPNGKDAPRDVLYHNGAAAVVPILDDGRILFVRQYREAARAKILEIPAGKLDSGEDPLSCAERELEEETGYRAGSMRFMTRFYTAIGYSTEIIHVYLAEGLTPGQKHPDEDEFLTLESYNIQTALDMIDSGEIMDAKTVTAVLYYERMRRH